MELSAAIITFNEDRNIGRCLESLQGVVDEVIVVDSFSTDQTVSICEKYGARIYQRAFTTYADQKNYAAGLCRADYILSIDADEALSPELAQSVKQTKTTFRADAFSMNRRNSYCGQWIRFGGWYPDRKIRLWHRSKGQWGGPNPHETLILQANSRVDHLKGDLLHYTIHSPEEHLHQIQKFSALQAEHMLSEGRRAHTFHLWLGPVVKFLRMYLFKLGFLDGRAGFRIARNSAYAYHLKYRMLQSLHKTKST